MTLSRHEARTLDALTSSLRASDPELAALLSGGVPRADPARDGRRRGDGLRFLAVLVSFAVGVIPLAIGIVGHTSWLVQAGAPAAILLPVTVMAWVCLRRPQP